MPVAGVKASTGLTLFRSLCYASASMNTVRVGVALSGGTAKTIAHIGVFEALVHSVFWFNPIVWLARRQIGIYREALSVAERKVTAQQQ